MLVCALVFDIAKTSTFLAVYRKHRKFTAVHRIKRLKMYALVQPLGFVFAL